MGKLWVFGDSFTAGHGCRNFYNNKSTYTELFKNYIDESKPIWSNVVADHFNLELNNLGRNGITNDDILDSVFDNTDNFDKDDMVIIQMSTSARYSIPFPKQRSLLGDKFLKDNSVYRTETSPFYLKSIFIKNIEGDYEFFKSQLDGSNFNEGSDLFLSKQKYIAIKSFFEEFLVTGKFYERELWRFIKISNIIKKMIGCKVYLLNEDFWSEHIEKPDNLIVGDIEKYSCLMNYIYVKKQTIYDDTNHNITDFHPSYDGHLSIGNFIVNFIENENINIHNT